MGKRDDQLDQEEAAFALLVAQALTETADEFAASVAGATELVAARFSVGRIARMWGNRTRTLVRRLLGTAEAAAVAAAEDTGTTLPEGWDDLPGRYDDGTLPEGIGQYVTTTEHLLRAVGDRLSEAARRELAAGLDAGEDIDQLRDRLREAFARDGAQLGPAREQRVAQTEASRAWNTATLAAAQTLTGPDRPLVKQWRCVLPGTPVTASGVMAAARRRYSGSVVRLDSAAGRRVSLTPEHQVLTTRGWLPAEALRKGDRLFQITGIQPIGTPEVQHPPAKIGEVVDAVMASMPVEVRTMASGVDLDGNLPDREVEVVAAHGGLAQHFQPSVSQGAEDVFLIDAHVLGELAVLADGDLLGGLTRERPAACCRAHLGEAERLSLGVLTGGPDATSAAQVPDHCAERTQNTFDDGRRALVSGSETGEAGAGLVRLCDGLGRKVVAASSSNSERLRGTGLGEPAGVTGEGESGGLGHGSKRDSSSDETALHGHGRRVHRHGDLAGALAGFVATDHLVDIEGQRNVAIGIAPVVHQDGRDAGTTDSGGTRDLGGLLSTVKAAEDVRNEVPQFDGRLACRARATDLDARFDQPGLDGGVAHAELASELAGGRSSLVALDEVVDIEIISWDGHVYDLSTAGSWYAADGLVVHNSTLDDRVRAEHREANGQLQFLDDPFTVGGIHMSGPGDPSAPPSQTVNCRCRLALVRAEQAAALEPQAGPRPYALESQEMPVDPTVTAAADGSHHTGAMIALMPTPEDAERLALAAPGAEPADELHLTLFYLGEGADWPEEYRTDLIDSLRSRLEDGFDRPIAGRAFGANLWNADRGEACWVWAVGDDPDVEGPPLESARLAAIYALENMHRQPDLPAQHSPWQAHVSAAYSSSPSLLTAMTERLGPITFDRVRVAYAGQYTDIPLGPVPQEEPMPTDVEELSALEPRAWHNPDDTALVYENLETGDGRVFRPGALYWGAGPWPLQYADEMLGAHQGAELAGAILTLDRDGDRIPGTGVLYPSRPAGADALTLLEEKAPLGVSVDLDDVSVEFVDRVATDDGGEEDGVVIFAAALPHASVLRLGDGSYSLTASSTSEWISAGASLARTGAHGTVLTGPGGRVEASAVTRAFSHLGLRDTGARVTAAAGDPNDEENGTVVHRESSGDLLMRVTRARVRGATLVAMPAYDTARIVLVDDPNPELAASSEDDQGDEDLSAGGGPSAAHLQVVALVKASAAPVGARTVSRALGMKMATARGHLARAAKAGRIVRLAPGLYVGPQHKSEEDLEASASGQLDLPVEEDRDRPWDGDEAKARLLDAATVDGAVDPDRLAAGFLWRDDDADPATAGAYRLPFADVIDGELRTVASGVYAVAAALQDARGGADIPEADMGAVKERVEALYGRLADTFDDPSIIPPWMDEDGDRDRDDEDDDGEETAAMKELVASAWTAMKSMPPMPAAWFREPTAAELPPGSGGVHYKDGRVFGWVAQTGEPHAGYPGRNLTIESLGKLDLTHFLRAKFDLDDGSTVRAGAFTMNVPHNRDGAECNSAACQFDDSRTVAGIVTVGQNAGGLWFSGAAAPWLSEWDRTVFMGCQPSYHMKQGAGGRWQLRAVLSVPVPGHSSPLLAAAVTERSNLALAASAAVAEDMEARLRTLSARVSDTVPASSGQDTDAAPVTTSDLPGHRPDTGPDPVRTASGQAAFRSADADAIAVALVSSERFIDGLLTAMERRQEQRDTHARQEAERLAASVIAPARAGLTTGKTTILEGAV